MTSFVPRIESMIEGGLPPEIKAQIEKLKMSYQCELVRKLVAYLKDIEEEKTDLNLVQEYLSQDYILEHLSSPIMNQ